MFISDSFLRVSVFAPLNFSAAFFSLRQRPHEGRAAPPRAAEGGEAPPPPRGGGGRRRPRPGPRRRGGEGRAGPRRARVGGRVEAVGGRGSRGAARRDAGGGNGVGPGSAARRLVPSRLTAAGWSVEVRPDVAAYRVFWRIGEVKSLMEQVLWQFMSPNQKLLSVGIVI